MRRILSLCSTDSSVLVFGRTVKGYHRRIFTAFLRRLEALPEIIKQFKYNLVLCVNEKDRECHIACGKDIGQRPEYISFYVVENYARKHPCTRPTIPSEQIHRKNDHLTRIFDTIFLISIS